MKGKPFVEVRGYSKLEATRDMYISSNLYVSGTAKFRDTHTDNDMIISGNIVVLGKVYDADSNMILSSAVGSVIAASGVLEFPLDADADSAHVIANNTPLIFSSTAGSFIYVSGSAKIGDELHFPSDALPTSAHVIASGSNLILSSTAGSFVYISGSQKIGEELHFPSDALPTSAHVIASSSYLILSSTAGSFVHVSGSEKLLGELHFPSDALAGSAHIVASGSDLILSSSTSNIYLSGNLSTKPYYYCKTVSAGHTILGPTAPTYTQAGTFGALAFDADAEQISILYEIPRKWTGTEDMLFKVYWTNEVGTALSNTETVIWSIKYRNIDFEAGQVITANSVALGTDTYTQSGAGADGDTHQSEIYLTYNGADQALTGGCLLGITFSRSFSVDTYGSDALVTHFEICHSASGIIEHA